MNKPKPNALSAGFTIAELLLASAVFSLVLLAALTGFLQIGQLFYKGITITETQNAAKLVLDDLSSSIQTAPGDPLNQTSGYTYYCIGDSRYTYNLFHEVDISNPTYTPGGNYGLLKDKLAGSSPCAPPCAAVSPASCPSGSPASAVPFANDVVEMLGNKMRLAQLDVAPTSTNPASPTPNLFRLTVKVVFGDDNVLSNPSAQNADCQGSLSNQQFCAVHSLTTNVFRGYGS